MELTRNNVQIVHNILQEILSEILRVSAPGAIPHSLP